MEKVEVRVLGEKFTKCYLVESERAKEIILQVVQMDQIIEQYSNRELARDFRGE